MLLLNPDTEVTPGALDWMVRLMEARPDIGMASCRLVQPDGTFDHAAKRSFPTPLGALAHFTGLGRRAAADTRLAQYRAPELDELDSGEVDAVNGAFMLVRDTALEEVGPARRGLLALHGRPRLVLPLQAAAAGRSGTTARSPAST